MNFIAALVPLVFLWLVIHAASQPIPKPDPYEFPDMDEKTLDELVSYMENCP